MLWNGVVIMVNSSLNLSSMNHSKESLKKNFKAIMAFSLWALSELFLVIVSLVYLDYANYKLRPLDWLIVLRLLTVPVALFRIYQVIMVERSLALALINE